LNKSRIEKRIRIEPPLALQLKNNYKIKNLYLRKRSNNPYGLKLIKDGKESVSKLNSPFHQTKI
jgi:hypothetical protein